MGKWWWHCSIITHHSVINLHFPKVVPLPSLKSPAWRWLRLLDHLIWGRIVKLVEKTKKIHPNISKSSVRIGLIVGKIPNCRPILRSIPGIIGKTNLPFHLVNLIRGLHAGNLHFPKPAHHSKSNFYFQNLITSNLKKTSSISLC